MHVERREKGSSHSTAESLTAISVWCLRQKLSQFPTILHHFIFHTVSWQILFLFNCLLILFFFLNSFNLPSPVRCGHFWWLSCQKEPANDLHRRCVGSDQSACAVHHSTAILKAAPHPFPNRYCVHVDACDLITWSCCSLCRYFIHKRLFSKADGLQWILLRLRPRCQGCITPQLPTRCRRNTGIPSIHFTLGRLLSNSSPSGHNNQPPHANRWGSVGIIQSFSSSGSSHNEAKFLAIRSIIMGFILLQHRNHGSQTILINRCCRQHRRISGFLSIHKSINFLNRSFLSILSHQFRPIPRLLSHSLSHRTSSHPRNNFPCQKLSRNHHLSKPHPLSLHQPLRTSRAPVKLP